MFTFMPSKFSFDRDQFRSSGTADITGVGVVYRFRGRQRDGNSQYTFHKSCERRWKKKLQISLELWKIKSSVCAACSRLLSPIMWAVGEVKAAETICRVFRFVGLSVAPGSCALKVLLVRPAAKPGGGGSGSHGEVVE